MKDNNILNEKQDNNGNNNIINNNINELSFQWLKKLQKLLKKESYLKEICKI